MLHSEEPRRRKDAGDCARRAQQGKHPASSEPVRICARSSFTARFCVMRPVTENTRINSIRPVSTPAEVQAELPASDNATKIGSASCRERGCQHVKIAVDAVYLKKKTNRNKNGTHNHK